MVVKPQDAKTFGKTSIWQRFKDFSKSAFDVALLISVELHQGSLVAVF